MSRQAMSLEELVKVVTKIQRAWRARKCASVITKYRKMFKLATGKVDKQSDSIDVS